MLSISSVLFEVEQRVQVRSDVRLAVTYESGAASGEGTLDYASSMAQAHLEALPNIALSRQSILEDSPKNCPGWRGRARLANVEQGTAAVDYTRRLGTRSHLRMACASRLRDLAHAGPV